MRRLLEVERRQRRNLERSYRETLGALANALESRDFDTGAHSMRVQRYAWELTGVVAPELLADPSVEFGYLLHDIGKIGIPDRDPQQARAADAEERRVIETHTTLGAQIVADVGLLAGNGIADRAPPSRALGRAGLSRTGSRRARSRSRARIFAVADTLDAMTSNRPYRARGRLGGRVPRGSSAGAGAQFDPAVVEAFLGHEPTLHDLRRRIAA